MNPVLFNDKIKEMLLRPRVEAIHKLWNLFPDWEASPLFLYEEPSSEAETTAIVKAYQDDVFEAMPFPVFRLDITVGQTGHREYGKYKAKAVVGFYPDGPCVMARVDSLLHTEVTYEHRYDLKNHEALPIMMLVSGVSQSQPGSCDFLCKPNLLFGVGGRWLPFPDKKEPPHWVSNYVNGFLKSLAAFNLSAMSPNNHIAQVRPATNGTTPPRSVQWLEARTHYTLITHGHPANNPRLESGSRVQGASASAELHRMAHNRRAHQRTLRAARFRYARGKTIKVRAAWVGPREWKDKGGRQIYRILEPVE
jgi:hypothetical protein